MKRFLKWVGYIIGGFVLLILIAVGTVYAITSSRMSKTYPTEVETILVPTDPAGIERGRHLVSAVGKCAVCHGDNLAGKSVSDAAIFAKLNAPNLTSGKGGIGATYTDADWVRALRYGVRRDGKSLLFMPSEAFTHFSDADLGAMIAYLKTLPAADMTIEPARSIGPIARAVYLLAGFPLIPAEMIDRAQARPAVAEGVTVEYGRYLSQTGGCTSCHGANLAGGGSIEGVKVPNLTPAGTTKSWNEADFIKAIRTGTRPDGRVLSAVMPWPHMKDLTDDELRAMWMYMRSVPPVTAD